MTCTPGRRRLLVAGLLGGALGALAQQQSGLRIGAACADGALDCASAVTPAFDAGGRLWLACLGQGAASVMSSADGGRTFGKPLVLGRHGQLLDVGADARPAIAIDARGRIAVAYGVFAGESHAGSQIMVATSTDGGATFARPRLLSRAAASQRFPTFVTDASGAMFLAWIDQRAPVPLRDGRVASALGYAWSRDGGATFDADRLVADTTCDCCAPALALDPRQRPVLLYRNVVGTLMRDHAVVSFTDSGTPGAPRRVAADRWMIDGCPHHGPSLAVGADGTYHAAWYTLGDARKGLFYARSTDAGRTFSAPRPVGDAQRKAGRPVLLAHGDSVWLAWREFDGQRIAVKQRQSHNGGRTWSHDRVVADSADAADNPRLARAGDRVVLSWMTRAQGLRLIALEEA